MRGFNSVALLMILAGAMGVPLEDPVSLLRNSNLKFSNELYQEMAKTETSNFVFSPMSIHIALSMLYQGATDTTYKVLAEALHLPEASLAADGYQKIIENLNNVKGISIHLANKAYVAECHSLQGAFKEIIRSKFHSEVNKIDFNDTEQAAKIINSWVEEKTKHKIKELVQASDFDPVSTSLVLVNAIYFNGTWWNPFDEKDTRHEQFFIDDKQWISTSMMHQTKIFQLRYDSNLKAKILVLPYKLDIFYTSFEMTIILPDDRNGIKQLESKLGSYDLNQLQKETVLKKVEVTLPKFKIEGERVILNDILKKLGLKEIMDDSAKFEKIIRSKTDERGVFSVNKVVHKTFIEITEQKTEAAASTGITSNYVPFSIQPIEPYKQDVFKADHPFIFLLRESRNGPVLFYGRVTNPDSSAQINSN